MSDTLQCTLLPVPEEILDPLSFYISHTWNVYRLSPLQNLKLSDHTLKRYALCLKKRLVCESPDGTRYKTSFSAIPSLTGEESQDVKIEVTVAKDNGTFVLKYYGVLLTPFINSSKEYNKCPLLLSKGTVTLKETTHKALSLMFGCVVQSYKLCETNFKWISGILAALGCFKENKTIKFTYVINEESIKEKINCSLSSNSLHQVWKRLCPRSSNITKEEVDLLYTSILEHFMYSYGLNMRYCILIDAKYPIGNIRKDGTIKVHDKRSLYEILHFFINAAQASGPLELT